MINRLFTIKNEEDYIRLKELLDGNGISYTESVFSDSAFPMLNDAYESKIISVDEKHTFLIYSELNMELESSLYVESEPAKKWRYIIPLALFGLIMSLLLYMKHDAVKRNNEPSKIAYEFNWNNTIMTGIQKSTGKNVVKYFDDNNDYNYELAVELVNGKEMARSYDSDEDGLFDQFTNFNLKGDISSESVDKDKDQIFEKLKIILENRDTLLIQDRNGNGQYETSERLKFVE